MATQSDLVNEAAKGALDEIKKRAPEEYAKLEADPAKKRKVFAAAAATANEYLNLGKDFTGEPSDMALNVTQHFSEDRIKLLQGGLLISTFKMKILKKDDGKYWLEITSDGKQYLHALATQEDIDWGTVEQYASIMIEAVLLVMSAVGIKISPSAKVIQKTVDETADAIRKSSQMQRALDAFVKAWNAAGSNPVKMATALFNLLKDSYAAGLLWTIIESLCSNMEWYDWLETAARVTAMIIAALASGGTALIAKIALVVLSAVDFAVKIVNIGELSSIKKNL